MASLGRAICRESGASFESPEKILAKTQAIPITTGSPIRTLLTTPVTRSLPASVPRRAFRLLAPFAAALAATVSRGFRVRLLAGGIALAALMTGATPAAASSLIIPGAFKTAEGADSYGFLAEVGGITFQQEYDASLLPGLVVGDVITGLQFRLDGTEPNSPAASVVIANFDVYLGPSAFAAGALTSSVAANQGAGTVLARSGSLSIPAHSFTGGAGPNPFGLQIVFTTPFTYTGGNLLLTLTYSAPTTDLYFDLAATVTGAQARTEANYNSPTVTNDLGTKAIVTEFTYTAAPEPTTAVLLLGGAALLGWRRRRPA